MGRDLGTEALENLAVLRNGSIPAWWGCGGKGGEVSKELEMRFVDLAGT